LFETGDLFERRFRREFNLGILDASSIFTHRREVRVCPNRIHEPAKGNVEHNETINFTNARLRANVCISEVKRVRAPVCAPFSFERSALPSQPRIPLAAITGTSSTVPTTRLLSMSMPLFLR
jgi:hypothetical protein